MKYLLTSLTIVTTLTFIAPERLQAAPAPSTGPRARLGLFGKAVKKRRPPVLPYERALRRNELFR